MWTMADPVPQAVDGLRAAVKDEQPWASIPAEFGAVFDQAAHKASCRNRHQADV